MSKIRTRTAEHCNDWMNFYLSNIQDNTKRYAYYKDIYETCLKSESNKEKCNSFGREVDGTRILIDDYTERLADHESECEFKLRYLK